MGPPVDDAEGEVEIVVATVADGAGLTAGESDAEGSFVLSILADAVGGPDVTGGNAVEAGTDVADKLTAEFIDKSAEWVTSVLVEDETEAAGGVGGLRGVSSCVVSSFSDESGVNEMLLDFSADTGASLSDFSAVS